jgi:hypothetical protein
MEETGFGRSLAELRVAGEHLRAAGELFTTDLREDAGAVLKRSGLAEPLARLRDSRIVASLRRRIERVSVPAGSTDDVTVVLTERLPPSRGEFDELKGRVARLEEGLRKLAAERAA